MSLNLDKKQFMIQIILCKNYFLYKMKDFLNYCLIKNFFNHYLIINFYISPKSMNTDIDLNRFKDRVNDKIIIWQKTAKNKICLLINGIKF